MASYEIYIGNYDSTKVYKLSTLPKELPSLSSDSSNETFETYWDGTYNFIEKKGLIELTLEGWLPRDYTKYNFLKSKINASEIIKLIEDAKTNTEPIKIVINDVDGYYVNDTFSVEKFSYKVITRGDYTFSLSVKQWRAYSETITATTYTVGWGSDSTGWYYYYDTSGDYYKDSWQLLDNEWYSFDPQGYARQSAWIEDGGNDYYLKDDCKMCRNEWLYYNYKYYYFGSDGAMYYGGTFEIDGTNYTFDSDGKLEE